MTAIATLPWSATPPPEPQSPAVFDAVLTPNRSLRGPAFLVLAAIFAGLSTVAAVLFVHLGAWPVVGFFGLDLVLFALAFHLSYRQGRMLERVRVCAERLHVVRRYPTGREQHWSLAPFFARVEIDDPVRHDSQVRVMSHGKTLILASFLSPDERGDFARALREALHKAQTARP